MENLALNSSFWPRKRVLLTGHTGFKGSWLTLWLRSLGAEVAGFALAPATKPALFELADIGADMRSEIGDVRDLEKLSTLVADFQPEIIFHLAAQSLVRPSYVDPVETFGTNAMGTVNVLEAARECSSLQAVVNVTTDKCYENSERQEGYREDEPLGGHDPYSSSKACAEHITSAYRRSFSLPVASARAGNVIGGGDWAEDRLLPDMMRSFIAAEPLGVRNPTATRPWQHVLDPLFGYLLLAERVAQEPGKYAQAWNFGPEDEDAKPVAWLADRVCALWGDTAKWSDASDPSQPHEAGFLRLNCDKARRQLGWQPRMNLDQALSWTVEWYRALESGADARAHTLQQISDYESGASNPR